MISSYDEKSFELAEYFLEPDPDFRKLSEADRRQALDQLAKVIQTALEDWLAAFGDLMRED